MSTTDTSFLPDFALVSRSALGPALNEQGYNAGRVERAVDEIAAANGVSNTVTHLINSHHHANHIGVLAAADVFTESTTFQVMQSIRLDLDYASYVHP